MCAVYAERRMNIMKIVDKNGHYKGRIHTGDSKNIGFFIDLFTNDLNLEDMSKITTALNLVFNEKGWKVIGDKENWKAYKIKVPGKKIKKEFKYNWEGAKDVVS